MMGHYHADEHPSDAGPDGPPWTFDQPPRIRLIVHATPDDPCRVKMPSHLRREIRFVEVETQRLF